MTASSVDPYPVPSARIDLYTCQWFIHCGNAPTGAVQHPVIGAVPCCQRCATALRLALRPLDVAVSAEDWRGIR